MGIPSSTVYSSRSVGAEIIPAKTPALTTAVASGD
jgi:hypothetical protein